MCAREARLGLAGLLLAAAVGCSSSKSGSVSVHLVDGPGDYQQINLHVVRVEIHGDGGWTTLSEPDQTYDLLALRGGVIATLASGVSLPAGNYSQVRLVLGAGNTVKLEGGAVEELDVPSGLRSGLKIVCNTRVEEGSARDVYIDFDGHRSIFLHETGSGRYILRPVVHCVDEIATGSISGQVTSSELEEVTPLAGVPVTAQTLDVDGNPSVVRTVTTGLDGKYTLDLLPLGVTYFVVTQPVVGTDVYAAKASGPLALTPAAPVAAYGVEYPEPVDSGSVAGTITPTAGADDADEVLAVQPLDAGGTAHRFVVRSALGAVGAGVESYTMANLPVGTYSLQVVRRTLVGGVETVTQGAAVSAEVTAGETTTANLTVP
jgi:hypothetical protein